MACLSHLRGLDPTKSAVEAPRINAQVPSLSSTRGSGRGHEHPDPRGGVPEGPGQRALRPGQVRRRDRRLHQRAGPLPAMDRTAREPSSQEQAQTRLGERPRRLRTRPIHRQGAHEGELLPRPRDDRRGRPPGRGEAPEQGARVRQDPRRVHPDGDLEDVRARKVLRVGGGGVQTKGEVRRHRGQTRGRVRRRGAIEDGGNEERRVGCV